MSKFRIEKRDYSRGPWRLVTESGREVYVPTVFDHPDLGKMTHGTPVCGNTKAELIERVLDLLASFVDTELAIVRAEPQNAGQAKGGEG